MYSVIQDLNFKVVQHAVTTRDSAGLPELNGLVIMVIGQLKVSIATQSASC